MGEMLSPLELAQIRFIRASFDRAPLDRGLRLLQRSVGQWWIRAATRKIAHLHHAERLPAWDAHESYVCVCNHRSFFDLYMVTAYLVAEGLPHRILFPVKSSFFYDNPLGPLVNGIMSFFAMYPPIFRDPKRAALNLASLDEMAAVLRRGGFFVGIHPEGTRNKGDDPYSYLPAQSGVGRVIRKARVPVIPVFVNGLLNDLKEQVRGGLVGDGPPIHVVFGEPIDFGGLMAAPESPRTYKKISEICLERIAELGREEKTYREGTSA